VWDDASEPLEVNAVELPDLSVGRSKHGHPEWLRIDNGELRDGWGVIGVKVCDVPPERWLDGVFKFTFVTVHVPSDLNYPHSEVQAFQGDKHLNLLELLPELVHLEWREHLLREIEVFLKPHEPAIIRQDAPNSHVPELPIPK
jgi:hypothetical protein